MAYRGRINVSHHSNATFTSQTFSHSRIDFSLVKPLFEKFLAWLWCRHNDDERMLASTNTDHSKTLVLNVLCKFHYFIFYSSWFCTPRSRHTEIGRSVKVDENHVKVRCIGMRRIDTWWHFIEVSMKRILGSSVGMIRKTRWFDFGDKNLWMSKELLLALWKMGFRAYI